MLIIRIHQDNCHFIVAHNCTAAPLVKTLNDSQWRDLPNWPLIIPELSVTTVIFVNHVSVSIWSRAPRLFAVKILSLSTDSKSVNSSQSTKLYKEMQTVSWAEHNELWFQFASSSPATSPNISVSGSNMSPICSEEAPSVSPPLPPRIQATLPEPGARVPSSLADSAGHPPGFPALDPSNLAALSASYPRLGGGMMGLGAAMPALPYTSSEQNPYSSISMENFYSPLVSSKTHMSTVWV